MNFFCEAYFDLLKNIVMQYVQYNYDYCYLDAMHEKNRVVGTKTIIAGSSHAMNGIIESRIGNGAINFSISSQDLYFDYLHIRKAMEEGKLNIETCIISIGYYMLYQDLSLSKTMGHLMREVYYPLFEDVHHFQGNCSYDLLENVEYDRSIYSRELVMRLCREWSGRFFMQESSYYGSIKSRARNNILSLKNIVWSELNEREKEELALKRTRDHNRLRKHILSREENGVLLEEMAGYLYKNGIIPIFVIFPFTDWYNCYIDSGYKEDIYNLLEKIPVPVEFWDMNNYKEYFDDTDFLDTDHLNDKGAEKATVLLNEFLNFMK